MAKQRAKHIDVDLQGGPHNGSPRPDLQFPDPVNGEMIGGQVAAMRMSMRYKHTVFPWARRQGKTKFRQFVIQNEATITPGEYYAGICFPDHTTAAKIAQDFRKSWGGMVRDFKINDKDQDRWIELHPFRPPDRAPPTWFTEPMKARWERCRTSDPNTYCRIYFWGCAYPHFEKVQGFPHPFHRVDWDECQQIHPLAYGIIRPMRRDVGAPECFSGTPWNTGIGNVQFEDWWNMADGSLPGWFRMRLPDGVNRHVIAVSEDEMRTMTVQQIRQTMYAEFLTGEGAIFSNLDAVLILKPIPPEDASLDWVRTIRQAHAMPSMEWWIHTPKPIPGHVYGASVDWARSPKGDYTVVTVFDFTTGKQAALLRWRGEDFTQQMEAVLAIQARYGAQQLHSDANGLGMTMSDFMRKRHALGFFGHNFRRDKEGYVTRGRVLFQDADVALIDCPEQRGEFKSYSAFEPKAAVGEKTIKYGAPPGKHDDIVSAFLQLAPTMTVVGRQAPPEPEPEEQPIFDKTGATTLELFSEGGRNPWDRYDDEGEEMSWNDVVLPRNYR